MDSMRLLCRVLFDVMFAQLQVLVFVLLIYFLPQALYAALDMAQANTGAALASGCEALKVSFQSIASSVTVDNVSFPDSNRTCSRNITANIATDDGHTFSTNRSGDSLADVFASITDRAVDTLATIAGTHVWSSICWLLVAVWGDQCNCNLFPHAFSSYIAEFRGVNLVRTAPLVSGQKCMAASL
jgi:hypothetical protein